MLLYVPAALFPRLLAPESPSTNIRDSGVASGRKGSKGFALTHNSWGDWVTQGRLTDSEVSELQLVCGSYQILRDARVRKGLKMG